MPRKPPGSRFVQEPRCVKGFSLAWAHPHPESPDEWRKALNRLHALSRLGARAGGCEYCGEQHHYERPCLLPTAPFYALRRGTGRLEGTTVVTPCATREEARGVCARAPKGSRAMVSAYRMGPPRRKGRIFRLRLSPPSA